MSKITYDYILKRLRLVDPASKINYDNASSGMTAATVQDAIDEVNTATTNLENNEKLVTYYEVVSGASSGNSVNVPTGGTIVLNKFGESKDAILSTVDGNNNITYESPRDSGGAIVTTSLDANGLYVFSGTPVNASVAIIYTFKITQLNWSNVNIIFIISESEIMPPHLGNRIIVTQANVAITLGSVIDPTKEYFLDGIIDVGATQITVPIEGINIKGYNFDLSGLVSTEDNYTMFISETLLIGSGDILGSDFYITTSGVNSKVYEIYDSNGLHAIELNNINYIDCTSLGDIHGYRQSLEIGTGRFGGSPSLTLHGTWSGGLRISTSITRDVSDTTAEPIFKEGTSLVINGRFITDMNVDLGDLQAFIDFSPSVFVNNESFIINSAYITRTGVLDSSDVNIIPNITSSSVKSFWSNNSGIENTTKYLKASVTTEVETVISAVDTYYDLLGTYLVNSESHLSMPTNGIFKALSGSGKYRIAGSLTIVGTANNVVDIRVVKSTDNGVSFPTVVNHVSRVINNLSGGRDVAFFVLDFLTLLNENDLVKLQVENRTGTGNVSGEVDNYVLVTGI